MGFLEINKRTENVVCELPTKMIKHNKRWNADNYRQ